MLEWHSCQIYYPLERKLLLLLLDIYKTGGQPMAERLTELFHCMWRKEDIPQEFTNASIIHYTSRKDFLKSVTTIEASLYC